MGFKDKLRRLEQAAGDLGGGPPPQAYYDARARWGRYMRAMITLGLDEELSEEERAFKDDYEGSLLKEEDTRLIERYQPPRSPEQVAEARARIRESLDEIVRRRRERGY